MALTLISSLSCCCSFYSCGDFVFTAIMAVDEVTDIWATLVQIGRVGQIGRRSTEPEDPMIFDWWNPTEPEDPIEDQWNCTKWTNSSDFGDSIDNECDIEELAALLLSYVCAVGILGDLAMAWAKANRKCNCSLANVAEGIHQLLTFPFGILVGICCLECCSCILEKCDELSKIQLSEEQLARRIAQCQQKLARRQQILQRKKVSAQTSVEQAHRVLQAEEQKWFNWCAIGQAKGRFEKAQLKFRQAQEELDAVQRADPERTVARELEVANSRGLRFKCNEVISPFSDKKGYAPSAFGTNSAEFMNALAEDGLNLFVLLLLHHNRGGSWEALYGDASMLLSIISSVLAMIARMLRGLSYIGASEKVENASELADDAAEGIEMQAPPQMDMQTVLV